ncbi:MAG: hypothetical protein KF685_01935 [Acidobacteria bacterium]|nr:hypothetical protein [Acidobacteriota bacterium]
MSRFFRGGSLAIFAVGFVLLFSIEAFSQEAAVRRSLVKNKEHIAYIDRANGKLTLVVEFINDFSDETKGRPPARDFVWIGLDINRNKTSDSGPDAIFSSDSATNTLCAQTLYGEQATSGCGAFVSTTTYEASFKATEAQSRPHPVFTFVFDEREIMPDGKGLNLIIRVHSADVGMVVNYPERAPGKGMYSFAKTINVKF